MFIEKQSQIVMKIRKFTYKIVLIYNSIQFLFAQTNQN